MRSSVRSAAATSDVAPQLLFDHRDGDLHQVAHHRLAVPADIADLGEFARFDFEEGRSSELGESAGDLGLADAGRPDHQDVLRQDLVGHRAFDLLPPPAIAQGDGDRALGGLLADDVLVELGDDLAWGQVLDRRSEKQLAVGAVRGAAGGSGLAREVGHGVKAPRP